MFFPFIVQLVLSLFFEPGKLTLKFESLVLQIPPVHAALPALEMTIAEYFYKSIFPLANPTPEELNFTKDAIATLVRLIQPLNLILGRPQDPELEKLLRDYDTITQCRIKLQMEAPMEVISAPLPPQPELPVVHALPPVIKESSAPLHVIPGPIVHTAPIVPHVVEIVEPNRQLASRPSISDPRTLPQYCQANIDLLYKNLTHRCSTCGLRFKTGEDLSAHLDWHYFERTSHLGRQSGRGSKLQRQWYLSAQEWVETNGGTTGQLKNDESKVSSGSAPKDGSEASGVSEKRVVRINDGEHEVQVICKACGDEIDQPEYDEKGWFYPNTVRAEDGTLYHEKCAPQLQQQSISQSTQSLVASSDSNIANNSSSMYPEAQTPIANRTKKRAHEDDVGDSQQEDGFDELMVSSPQTKKQKTAE